MLVSTAYDKTSYCKTEAKLSNGTKPIEQGRVYFERVLLWPDNYNVVYSRNKMISQHLYSIIFLCQKGNILPHICNISWQTSSPNQFLQRCSIPSQCIQVYDRTHLTIFFSFSLHNFFLSPVVWMFWIYWFSYDASTGLEDIVPTSWRGQEIEDMVVETQGPVGQEPTTNLG